jgi:thiol-disulfide isomerase/thioredoxin
MPLLYIILQSFIINMSALLNLLYLRFKRYLPVVYGVIFVIFVVVIANYVYKNYYLPAKKEKVFQDVANANPIGRNITIFMFHVDWCPHCKKAMPEWKMFSDQYNNTSLNGYQIECRDVDCTNSDDPEIKILVDKYSLKQYPTVLASVPGANGKENRVDYEAKVKKQYLEQFATSLTTENTSG